MNINNQDLTTQRYPSSDTRSLKDGYKRRTNMKSEYNLQSQLKEKSSKIIDSKLGKIVQVKSQEMAAKNRNELRPTVPNKARPSSHTTAATTCKTLQAPRKTKEKVTNPYSKNLVIDRRSNLSPINIEKWPQKT